MNITLAPLDPPVTIDSLPIGTLFQYKGNDYIRGCDCIVSVIRSSKGNMELITSGLGCHGNFRNGRDPVSQRSPSKIYGVLTLDK